MFRIWDVLQRSTVLIPREEQVSGLRMQQINLILSNALSMIKHCIVVNGWSYNEIFFNEENIHTRMRKTIGHGWEAMLERLQKGSWFFQDSRHFEFPQNEEKIGLLTSSYLTCQFLRRCFVVIVKEQCQGIQMKPEILVIRIWTRVNRKITSVHFDLWVQTGPTQADTQKKHLDYQW